jgi:cytochrome c peroxidase
MQRISIVVAAVAALCVGQAFAQGLGGKPLSPAAVVGKHMFFDRHLSGSGQIACSTCHDPDHAYGPPNGLAVQPGGEKLTEHGTRAVPSLRYQEFTPAYSDMLDNPDGLSKPGPGGGLTLDGRAPTLAAQSSIPLLAGNEMANRSEADVVQKIAQSDYASLFRAAFGEDIFASPKEAFLKAAEALQAFQLEDLSFHPYTSKYDRLAANKLGGTLTPAEQRGFAVFTNPDKGNCFACHYNGPGLGGSIALFTDFTYSAVGVPRNSEIPANRRKGYYDMGICSRQDHPLPDNARYCGMFKTPTLRNAASRQVFFHNGRFKSLADVIRFYNTRDTNPERWYPTVHGVPKKFDDLPKEYQANIDTQMPLDGRARGSTPPMTDQEMEDLEAFLGTLTDDDVAQRQALKKYLGAQGHVCVGKFDWPIEVSQQDFQHNARDAVQMPVLEKLGLVTSTVASAQRVVGDDGATETIPVKRYELTEAGRRSYVDKDITTRGPGAAPIEHHKDLCAAKLTIDKIVRFDESLSTAGVHQGTIFYTYHVTAMPWALSADAQKVFPMVARIIKGEGILQLEQRMQLGTDGWVVLNGL